VSTLARAAFPPAFAALVCAACLDGNAEPIVRLPQAAGTGDGGACDPSAPIVLYYRNAQPAASTDQIDYLFKVVNDSGAAIPLSSLAIRYYFTNDLTTAGQTAVYFTDTCCGTSRTGFTADVVVTINAISPPVTGADTYLEATFDSAAGVVQNGDDVQVEIGFHAVNYTQNLQQTNDYSFIASAAGTQMQWDACPAQCANFHSCLMTVYKDGVLVWGQPP
jgi:hypothetical protein